MNYNELFFSVQLGVILTCCITHEITGGNVLLEIMGPIVFMVLHYFLTHCHSRIAHGHVRLSGTGLRMDALMSWIVQCSNLVQGICLLQSYSL